MKPALPVDLVVFDMAGTTVHDGDAVNVSLRDALLRMAKHEFTRDEVNRFMGIQKPLAIRALLKSRTGAEPSAQLIEAAHDEFVDQMLRYYSTSPEVREVEGASELFRSLRSMGIKIGIDTGFSRSIARVILDRLGWERDHLIDVSVTADEVTAGRPAPFMIYRCMEVTGVHNVARVVKVGDTPSDLQQGTNARCGLVVGVTSGSHTAEQLKTEPHSFLIHAVTDLQSCLVTGHASLPMPGLP